MISDTFNFSAVQAITRWITDSVENCSSVFMPLAMQAHALSETVSLSSGLGLTEIWSAFFIDELPSSAVTKLEVLEKLTSSLGPVDQSRRHEIDFLHISLISYSSTTLI
jgi:midasin